MKFFLFELKRFISNPKNKICLILLIVIFFGLFSVNQTIFKQKFYESDKAIVKLNLQQTKENIIQLERELLLNPTDSELEEYLELARKEEEITAEQLVALEKKDFRLFAQLEQTLVQGRMSLITDKSSEEYQDLLAKSNYYHAVVSSGGTFSSSANSVTDAAFLTGRLMMSWLSSTVIFIIVTVLVADSVSNEIESSQIRFYSLLNGRLFGHLIIKLLVPVFAVLVAVISAFSVIYVIQGGLDNFGTWHYPYLMTDGVLLPIWEIALRSIFLFIIALFYLGSLGQLLSLVLKKSLLVTGSIVVMQVAFLSFSQEEWFQSIKLFLPFEYLSYGQLLNDKIFLPDNAFVIGTIYLLVMILTFTLLSGYLYKNYYYRKVGKE